jgi:hypothetical protein
VINMARHGVPAIGMITARFAEQAVQAAISLGLPEAPMLHLPYPVAGTGDEAMKQLAAGLVPEVIRTFRGGQ